MYLHDDPLKNLTALGNAVREATEHYTKCKTHEDMARRETTGALNALNVAQRRFDEATQAFRKSAPQATDWQARIVERA